MAVKATILGTGPVCAGLTAQPEALDERVVPTSFLSFQVVQQPSALADHNQQAPAGVEILLVYLQVLSQVRNTLGQDRDLNFGRTGVAFMGRVFRYQFAFALGTTRSSRASEPESSLRRPNGAARGS